MTTVSLQHSHHPRGFDATSLQEPLEVLAEDQAPIQTEPTQYTELDENISQAAMNPLIMLAAIALLILRSGHQQGLDKKESSYRIERSYKSASHGVGNAYGWQAATAVAQLVILGAVSGGMTYYQYDASSIKFAGDLIPQGGRVAEIFGNREVDKRSAERTLGGNKLQANDSSNVADSKAAEAKGLLDAGVNGLQAATR